MVGGGARNSAVHKVEPGQRWSTTGILQMSHCCYGRALRMDAGSCTAGGDKADDHATNGQAKVAPSRALAIKADDDPLSRPPPQLRPLTVADFKEAMKQVGFYVVPPHGLHSKPEEDTCIFRRPRPASTTGLSPVRRLRLRH